MPGDERRQYVNFGFFQVDPAWRRLPAEARKQGKEEFLRVVEAWLPRMIVRSYTLVGLRADCDLMLWRITRALEDIPQMTSELLNTGLGRYLRMPYNYLAMTKRSVYVDKINPEHGEQRLQVAPGKSKYLFVYPFVKTREWYRLDKAVRQKIMDGHIQVGAKYPSVKLNTTYSFGLDDQEFVVAFETDRPDDFLDLVMELREVEASRYTLRDTPIFTCMARDLKDALDLLG